MINILFLFDILTFGYIYKCLETNFFLLYFIGVCKDVIYMKPILIVIAGGSASGKTTVVNKIYKSLGNEDLVVIKHDDYYLDQSNLSIEERKKTNYDHPSSLENDLLYDDLKKLLSGKTIEKPIYDFVSQNRRKETEIIEPKSVIILEGILALEDERIRDLANIKVFVNCDDDLRFIRRLKRDINERGRTVENVINQYLTTVRPMHHLFVRPSIRYADIIIPNDRNHVVGTDMLIRSIKDLIKENKKRDDN